MNILKKATIISLLLILIVSCTKKESTRSSNDQAAREMAAQAEAEKMAAEAKAEKMAAEAKAEKMAAEAKAEKMAAEAKAEKMAAEAKAEKMAAEAKAEKMAAEAKAEKMAAEAKAEKMAADAKVEKMAADAKAEKMAADAEAAKMAAQVKAEQMAANAKAEMEAAQAEKKAAEQAITKVADLKEYDFSTELGDKTPVGAQKSGNAAGTIPAWTGGITSPPSQYKSGDHHQDPFANDKILFTIDANNYNDYAENLSVGQKAMFDKYPATYKMHVYQTRRSASFPQRIYAKTVENGKTGELTGGGEGVKGVAEGFPFPNADNAYKLMLNHKMKFKGSGGVRYNNQVAPTANGRYTVVKLKEELLGKYYTEGNTVEDINNILLYFYQVVESPARLAGRILLVHETMNQQEQPRQAWIYNPGQRRVRRAPNVAYDNPGTASDGLRTNDMTDMFNGAMDRFDWKVVGKKEMYVPYNSYKVHSGELDYPDIVGPGHLNVDLMRYELHRMYVVEATLKEGVRHINSRRTFYLDEDSYQIMLTDHYDRRGNIWRFSEAHCINYYDVPTFWSTVESHHDLRSGRYVAVGLDNKDPVNTFNVPLSEANYTPQSLRKRGRR